jgi:hypothetical protein
MQNRTGLSRIDTGIGVTLIPMEGSDITTSMG